MRFLGFGRAMAALAALCLAFVLGAGGAEAHAILVKSYPESGATVPGPHVALELHFNSRIDKGLSRLELVDPHKVITTLQQNLGGEEGTMEAALDLVPGDYILRWQVTAVDGHITRGTLPFTVAGR